MDNTMKDTNQLFDVFDEAGFGSRNFYPSVGNGVVVFTMGNMTTLETLKAIQHLTNVREAMINSICVVCDSCFGCTDDCPYDHENYGYIDIPEKMREACGIPDGVKIRATPVRNGKRVVLTVDGPTPDIRDVPKDMVELMLDENVCLRDLDQLIRLEIPAYDGACCSDTEEEDD